MNNWLYLTAQGLASAAHDWPCCVWSSTGQRQLTPLNQAAQLLDGRSVNLLLPMESCSWVRSQPWPSRRAPGAQAIAFAVEDQLSEALENLHLSIGPRDKDGRYPVMVIGRERFAALLRLMAESGVRVRSVFVDADVMPGPEPTVIRWFDRWLLGGAIPARVAMADEGLTRIRSALPQECRWMDEREDQAHVDQCLTLAPTHAINLLQGPFAPHSQRMPWFLCGATLLLMMALTWGASATRMHFLESETRRLQSQNEQRFKALHPDQSRIVDLVSQLKLLQGQTAEPQNTRIAGLVTLVERVIGASHIDVRRIEFRAGDGWKIQLSANSFAELEQLRERGRQQGVPVRLDNANKERDRVQATLTVEDNT